MVPDIIAGYARDDPATIKEVRCNCCGKIRMQLKDVKIGIPVEFFGDGISVE